MHPWNQPILEAFRKRLDRLPHALLVHGPRGVGKLALAERLSQLLLCEGADKAKRPCGKCDACSWFAGGNHPDYRRVEPEIFWPEPPEEKDRKPSRVIKIDQIRELDVFLNTKSHRAGLRVALFRPANDMQPAAATSLLKSLEEPPPGVVFILVAERPALLLPTIRSRCAALPVAVPPKDAALKWLAGEGVKNAERWLAYAGGAPLEALKYAANADTIDRFLTSLAPVTTRDELEPLAESLQKSALDHALAALGLPTRYQTPIARGGQSAQAWLAYARRMGRDRQLTSHTLDPKLFSNQMISGRPKS